MKTNEKRLVATFYKAPSGKEPVREWLKSLSSGNKKIVGVDIKTVEFGWPIGMPVCKPLGKGLYEVRSTLERGDIARVIFCIEDNLLLLLHAFIKKTQKTPQKELDLALARKKEIYR